MENAITTVLAIIINDAVAPAGAAGITGSKRDQQGVEKCIRLSHRKGTGA